jgi:hypothetical protein
MSSFLLIDGDHKCNKHVSKNKIKWDNWRRFISVMMMFSYYFHKCGRKCGYKFVYWEYDFILLLHGYPYVHWICNVFATFCFLNCIDFPCWHLGGCLLCIVCGMSTFLPIVAKGFKYITLSFAKKIMIGIGKNSFGSSDDFEFLFHPNLINSFFNATSHNMVELSY